MKLKVPTAVDYTPEIEIEINDLFNQLIPNGDQIDLKNILSAKNAVSIVCCVDEKNKVVGIASLGTYQAISGHKGWVEDVVVDSSCRGLGIGRKLMEKILEIGKEKELSEILLFTEDHRKPAINLYNTLEFKLKESSIYTRK